jgi:hypothetical protein
MTAPLDAKQSRLLQCMGRPDRDSGRRERLLATLGVRGAQAQKVTETTLAALAKHAGLEVPKGEVG